MDFISSILEHCWNFCRPLERHRILWVSDSIYFGGHCFCCFLCANVHIHVHVHDFVNLCLGRQSLLTVLKHVLKFSKLLKSVIDYIFWGNCWLCINVVWVTGSGSESASKHVASRMQFFGSLVTLPAPVCKSVPQCKQIVAFQQKRRLLKLTSASSIVHLYSTHCCYDHVSLYYIYNSHYNSQLNT